MLFSQEESCLMLQNFSSTHSLRTIQDVIVTQISERNTKQTILNIVKYQMYKMKNTKQILRHCNYA